MSVALGLAVALAAGVTVLAIAPWASGATQFRHSATSPTFELGSDQGMAITVTNVGGAAVSCAATIRAGDGSLLTKQAHSIDPGKSVVEGFATAPSNQFILRVVVSSKTSAKSNPCLPMIEFLRFPSQGHQDVDAVLSDFLVTNTAV